MCHDHRLIRPKARMLVIAGFLLAPLLANSAAAESLWDDDQAQLPGSPGLRTSVHVLIQGDAKSNLTADMRPLGEQSISSPLNFEPMEQPNAPRPAAVALAGFGLAALVTGKAKRREE